MRDYQINDQVVTEWDYYHNTMICPIGTILQLKKYNYFIIEWTIPNKSSFVSCEHISNLIPANEAIQKNKHLELELSKIEPQIKTQVKNIVDSLEQLNILLTSCGLSLFDIEDARNKINAGLENSGWPIS